MNEDIKWMGCENEALMLRKACEFYWDIVRDVVTDAADDSDAHYLADVFQNMLLETGCVEFVPRAKK